MALLAGVALVIGIVLIAAGMWLAWVPVSDRFVLAVLAQIEEDRGVQDDFDEVRDGIKHHRIRLGLYAGSSGVVVVVGVVTMIAVDSGQLL
jgi:hypothetical protein